MRCDLCDRPAVVHEVTMKNGVKREVHLCEEHAKESGVTMPSNQPISELLTHIMMSKASKPESTRKLVCRSCGMSFGDFRQKGVVGCPDCYKAFEKQLAPLIERTQNGAVHHEGKTPRRAGASLDRQLLIRRLAKELDEAVAAEQYERAADLRDRLNNLQTELSAPESDGA
ncbi:MAG: UvrB/UvrC motif-containing protein [Planctomycetota bacterium]|jgi:protein arginine kinase activator